MVTARHLLPRRVQGDRLHVQHRGVFSVSSAWQLATHHRTMKTAQDTRQRPQNIPGFRKLTSVSGVHHFFFYYLWKTEKNRMGIVFIISERQMVNVIISIIPLIVSLCRAMSLYVGTWRSDGSQLGPT